MTLCASMADRLLDAFPSGSYATVGLLRVFDIVESRDVATACVECRVAPCIKVNPDFVAKHAKTPEHLLMLVLHEVHHVILGHTRMFEGPGRLMNFVFDVVINGMLCRAFNGEAYTSFFTSYYDEGNFPLCLLRPPPGWPGRSDGVASGLNALAPNFRSVVAERHQQIYRFGASYDEVITEVGGTGAECASPMVRGRSQPSSTCRAIDWYRAGIQSSAGSSGRIGR